MTGELDKFILGFPEREKTKQPPSRREVDPNFNAYIISLKSFCTDLAERLVQNNVPQATFKFHGSAYTESSQLVKPRSLLKKATYTDVKKYLEEWSVTGWCIASQGYHPQENSDYSGTDGIYVYLRDDASLVGFKSVGTGYRFDYSPAGYKMRDSFDGVADLLIRSPGKPYFPQALEFMTPRLDELLDLKRG